MRGMTPELVHRISAVDPEVRIARCAICGPGVRVLRKSGPRGGYWVCRNRHLASKRAWARANPEVVAAHARRAQMKRRYGLTDRTYSELLAAQGGVCAVCQESPEEGRYLAVDHDHACCPDQAKSCGDCVRGLLCSRCNTGLGWFEEDVARLEMAAAYLRAHLAAAQQSDGVSLLQALDL